MSGAIIEQNIATPNDKVKDLNEQVATLKSQFADLKQRVFRSPALVRLLGKSLGFGAAGKIDWVYFKLRIKQEELAQFEQAEAKNELRNLTAQSTVSLNETSRQRMERMIKENPPALEPHFRLAYQPLIETEEAGKQQVAPKDL